MKSNVCTISQDSDSLKNILKESEKFALYSELDKKQTGRLRLLAEELVGMLPELLGFSSGEFWIEGDGKAFELHTKLLPNVSLTAERREKILSVSKSGKNFAAQGIMNKIRLAAEFMMIDYNDASNALPADMDFYSVGSCSLPMFSSMAWSLNEYRAKSEGKKGEAWDELEKSIIANIADDVLVAVRGSAVEIIVKKHF